MILLKILVLVGFVLGAWQSFKSLGKPIIRGGKRWYRQPTGLYYRWYGGRGRTEEQLGPPDPLDRE